MRRSRRRCRGRAERRVCRHRCARSTGLHGHRAFLQDLEESLDPPSVTIPEGPREVGMMSEHQCGESGDVRGCHGRAVPRPETVLGQRGDDGHSRCRHIDFRPEAAEFGREQAVPALEPVQSLLGMEAVPRELSPLAKRRNSQTIGAGGRVVDRSARVAGGHDAGNPHLLGSNQALLDDPRWLAPAKAHIDHVDAVLHAVVERRNEVAEAAAWEDPHDMDLRRGSEAAIPLPLTSGPPAMMPAQCEPCPIVSSVHAAGSGPTTLAHRDRQRGDCGASWPPPNPPRQP